MSRYDSVKTLNLLISGLVLCVLVAAGCSSGDRSASATAGETTSAQTEYERAFARADRELTSLVEIGSDGVATPEQTSDEIRADAVGYERIAADLAGVLPPDAVRAEHASFVDALRDAARGLRRAAELVEAGKDPSKDDEVMAPAHRLYAAWEALRAATERPRG